MSMACPLLLSSGHRSPRPGSPPVPLQTKRCFVVTTSSRSAAQPVLSSLRWDRHAYSNRKFEIFVKKKVFKMFDFFKSFCSPYPCCSGPAAAHGGDHTRSMDCVVGGSCNAQLSASRQYSHRSNHPEQNTSISYDSQNQTRGQLLSNRRFIVSIVMIPLKQKYPFVFCRRQ